MPHHLSEIKNKSAIYNGLFCCHRSFLEAYSKITTSYIKTTQKYIWGFDMITFTYAIHHTFPHITLLKQHEFRTHCYNFMINPDKSFQNQNFINPTGATKHFPYVCLFSNKSSFIQMKDLMLSLALSKLKNRTLAEDITHQYCREYGYTLGSFFWRSYPTPLEKLSVS